MIVDIDRDYRHPRRRGASNGQHDEERRPTVAITEAAILRAVKSLGRASPPQVRRFLNLPPLVDAKSIDQIATALERLRSEGKLAVHWSPLGNALYGLE